MRTRPIILALVVASGSLTPVAMAQIDPEWVSSHRDGDEYRTVRHAVAPDGASFAVASIEHNGGDDDIELVCFNPDGSFAWQRIWDGESDQDIAAGVAVSADGAWVYVLGRSSTLNFGDADFVILKYDATNGALEWTEYWDAGDLRIESPQCITALPDGGVVATGAAGTDGFKLDYGTVCLNADGTKRWDATFRGSGRFLFDNDQAYFAEPTPDDGVVVFGLASLFNGNEFRTIKYDAQTGATRWSKSYALATGPRDLAIAPNGDVVIFGEDPLGSDRRWVTIRYDGTTGTEKWMQAIDPGQDEHAAAVMVDAAGDVYCTGSTDPDGNDSNGNENWITASFDGQTGAVRWLDEWGPEGTADYDSGTDLWINGAGELMVVGFTSSELYVGEMYERDAVIRRLDPATGVQSDMGLIDLSDSQTRWDIFKRVGFDAAGNAYVHGRSYGDVGVSDKVFVAKFADTDGACRADFNDDGDVNTLDVLSFLNAWNAGEQAADFNEDGDINTLDVLAFLNAWNAGC